MMRAAIALRAARPGDATPDEAFVSDLHRKLSDRQSPPGIERPAAQGAPRHAPRWSALPPAWRWLEGPSWPPTASITPAVTTAVAIPRGPVIRTASFETDGGSVLGQIVVYDGHPSWVYMKVGLPE